MNAVENLKAKQSLLRLGGLLSNSHACQRLGGTGPFRVSNQSQHTQADSDAPGSMSAPAQVDAKPPATLARQATSFISRRLSSSTRDREHEPTDDEALEEKSSIRINELEQRRSISAAAERADATGGNDLLRGLAELQARSNSAIPWFLINPLARWTAAWDSLTSVALIFTAIATPFEVAFLPAPSSAGEPLFIVNRLIDLIFMLDIIKEFFLTYQSHRGVGGGSPGAEEWETDLGKIAKRYLRGWFALDIISILPSAFDIIPVVEAASARAHSTTGVDDAAPETSPVKALRVVRALRLIKLVRLVRASRVLGRLEMRFSFPRLTVICIRITCLTFAFGHGFACVLGMLVAFADSPLESWAGPLGYCTSLDGPMAIKAARQAVAAQRAGASSQQPMLPHTNLPPLEYVFYPWGAQPHMCVDPWTLYFQSLWWSLGLITSASIEPVRRQRAQLAPVDPCHPAAERCFGLAEVGWLGRSPAELPRLGGLISGDLG